MGQTELRRLIEALIPRTNKTQDGSIICPFCQAPQKQISSHIKKDHDGEMQERCKTKDSEEYKQELKRYLTALRKNRCIADKKLLDPVEFKRKQKANKKQYLKRLSDTNKTRLKEYKKKWDKMALIKSKTWEAAKKRFRQEILYGPSFECVCCRMMCFRHQVVPFSEQVQENIRAKAKAAAERQMKSQNATLDDDLLAKIGKVSFNEEEQQNTRVESRSKSPSESESRGPEESVSADSESDSTGSEEADLEGWEEETKLLASYHRWFERCDQIYDTLGKCQDEADALDLRKTSDKLAWCDDIFWAKRGGIMKTYDLMLENVLHMDDWTEEQERNARALSDGLDRDETNQKSLLELTMKILGLLKKGKKKAQAKRQHLAKMVEQLVDQIGKMFATCKCQASVYNLVTLFIVYKSVFLGLQAAVTLLEFPQGTGSGTGTGRGTVLILCAGEIKHFFIYFLRLPTNIVAIHQC